MKTQKRLAGLFAAAFIIVLFIAGAAYTPTSAGSGQAGSAVQKDSNALWELAAQSLPCLTSQNCAMPDIQARRPGGCPKPKGCPMPKIEVRRPGGCPKPKGCPMPRMEVKYVGAYPITMLSPIGSFPTG